MEHGLKSTHIHEKYIQKTYQYVEEVNPVYIVQENNPIDNKNIMNDVTMFFTPENMNNT